MRTYRHHRIPGVLGRSLINQIELSDRELKEKLKNITAERGHSLQSLQLYSQLCVTARAYDSFGQYCRAHLSYEKTLVGVCWHEAISNGDGFQFDYLCRFRRLLTDGCWLAPYDLHLLVTKTERDPHLTFGVQK